MNEVIKIPWVDVFTNFVWILGTSIILATFSYIEFLIILQKAKRTEVLKMTSLKKTFLLGMILVTAGISASVHRLFLTVITGVATFFLTVWLFKIITGWSVKRESKVEEIKE